MSATPINLEPVYNFVLHNEPVTAPEARRAFQWSSDAYAVGALNTMVEVIGSLSNVGDYYSARRAAM